MKNAIICDLDSTLCDLSHRLHFIMKEKSKDKDWMAFYAGMSEDPINDWCFLIIDSLAKRGLDILYVTGRPEEYKNITIEWLRRNNCPINGIFMRKTRDSREDCIVKKEIFETEIKNKYNIIFAIEDKESVTKTWRSLGLITLQCANGLY